MVFTPGSRAVRRLLAVGLDRRKKGDGRNRLSIGDSGINAALACGFNLLEAPIDPDHGRPHGHQLFREGSIPAPQVQDALAGLRIKR